jgi:acetyltransferase-like isoleucine patch superfamily enzyme
LQSALADAFPDGVQGTNLAPDVVLGADTHLGNHVTVYPCVEIGDGCTVMDGAVLGRLPIRNATSTRRVQTHYSPLVIGAGSILGCNCVLYTGSRIGKGVLIGDLASVREGCAVGDDVIIGRGVMVLYDCRIGRRTRIQDQAHLVGNMLIEEDVFVGMGVMTANDNDVYLSRFGLSRADLSGPVVRRDAVIGTGAVLLPKVEIGEGALVAAGAVVTRDVAPWTMVAGAPACYVRDVPPDERRQIEARRERA